jgi:hypothetical protein
VPSCTWLGGCGQFSQEFGGEVYDFYSVSSEYLAFCVTFDKSCLLIKSVQEKLGLGFQFCRSDLGLCVRRAK